MKKEPFGRRALLKAALLVTGSTYISFTLGLIVNTVIARGLGPEDFGRYSYLVWLGGLLTLIAVNGFSTTAIRFVSESLGRQEAQEARDIHAWLWIRQQASAGLVALAFLAASPWLLPAGWTGSVPLFVAVVFVAFVAKTAYLFDISVAKGYGRFSIEAWCGVAMSAASALGAVVLALMGASLTPYLLLFAAVSLGHGLLAWQLLRANDLRRGRAVLPAASAPRLRQHLFWTVVLALVAAFGNKSIEFFLLNRLVGAAEVGYFAIAAALTRAGMELLTAGLMSVLMPAMAHAYGAKGVVQVHAMLGNSVRYFFFAGLLLAGVGVLWADVAVSLLYGDDYRAAVPVLQAMLVVAGVTLPQGALGAMLSTTDNQRLRATVAAVSLIVSAGAAFMLVPAFGLAGAVASHVLSSLAIMVIVVVVMQRVLSVALPWRLLARLFLAALVAFAAAAGVNWWFAQPEVAVAAGLAYAVLLLSLSIALRAWSREEQDQFAAVLDRRLRLHRAARWLAKGDSAD